LRVPFLFEGFSVQRRRQPKQRPVKSKKKLNEVSYEVSGFSASIHYSDT
jgi:hypothetical protein